MYKHSKRSIKNAILQNKTYKLFCSSKCWLKEQSKQNPIPPKKELQKLIENNYSINDIMKYYKHLKNHKSVHYWLKLYGLKTKFTNKNDKKSIKILSEIYEFIKLKSE